jgi:hypothetical protein
MVMDLHIQVDCIMDKNMDMDNMSQHFNPIKEIGNKIVNLAMEFGRQLNLQLKEHF